MVDWRTHGIVDIAEGERPLGADEGLIVGKVQVTGNGQHQGVALEDGDLGGDLVGTLTAGGSRADAELVRGATADLNGFRWTDRYGAE